MTSGLSRFTRPFVLCSAFAMLVGSGAVAHADGIPRGGSCCADLEERIAELEATTARKGNRKVSLTISGQVTTAVMAWDAGSSNAGGGLNPLDGNQPVQGSDVYIADWTPAGGTYVSFAGSAKVSPTLTAGFQVVVAVTAGSRSHQVSQIDDDGGVAGDTEIVMTLGNWYLNHKSLGRLTVGRANTSTAGLSTIDLGGAGVAANASIGYWNRGFIVTGTTGGGADVNSGLNGWSHLLGGNALNGASLSRANVVKYDSAVFGGFSVSGSWGEDNQWDAALRYAGEFSGFRVAAGLGYRFNHAGTGEVTRDNPGVDGAEPEQFIASGSVLHLSSGLFLTGAYINQDNDTAGRPDSTLWYTQGGIAKNWTGLGKTVLYGEYARVEDGAQNFSNTGLGGAAFIPTVDSTAEMFGLGVVQHIDAAAMEVFLSYRRFSAEFNTGGFIGDIDINDVDMVVGGARIRF